MEKKIACYAIIFSKINIPKQLCFINIEQTYEKILIHYKQSILLISSITWIILHTWSHIGIFGCLKIGLIFPGYFGVSKIWNLSKLPTSIRSLYKASRFMVLSIIWQINFLLHEIWTTLYEFLNQRNLWPNKV